MEKSKKILVIYISKTGFTKRYAQWIAQRLEVKCISFKEYLKCNEKYDLLIFGEGLVNGSMPNLNKFVKKAGRDSEKIIFSTGATSIEDKETIDLIEDKVMRITGNNIKYFHFQSGLCYDKLSVFGQLVLYVIRKTTEMKKEKSVYDIEYLRILKETTDYCDVSFIEPLIRYINSEDI